METRKHGSFGSEARKRDSLLATIEDGLAERGQELASIETQALPVPLPNERIHRGPIWRSLASTVVGIVIVAFFATLPGAHSVPRVSRIEVPLVDPGFEEVLTLIPAVTWRWLDRWKGDASYTVATGGFSDAVFEGVSGFLESDINRFVHEVEAVEL